MKTHPAAKTNTFNGQVIQLFQNQGKLHWYGILPSCSLCHVSTQFLASFAGNG